VDTLPVRHKTRARSSLVLASPRTIASHREDHLPQDVFQLQQLTGHLEQTVRAANVSVQLHFSKALGIRGEGGAAQWRSYRFSGKTTERFRKTIGPPHIHVAYVYEFPKVANASRAREEFGQRLADLWHRRSTRLGRLADGAVSSNFGYSAPVWYCAMQRSASRWPNSSRAGLAFATLGTHRHSDVNMCVRIVPERSVVVPENRRIATGRATLTTNTKRLAEGVIGRNVSGPDCLFQVTCKAVVNWNTSCGQ